MCLITPIHSLHTHPVLWYVRTVVLIACLMGYELLLEGVKELNRAACKSMDLSSDWVLHEYTWIISEYPDDALVTQKR
jgi:hypothetical protein